jgi:hypothetical protein
MFDIDHLHLNLHDRAVPLPHQVSLHHLIKCREHLLRHLRVLLQSQMIFLSSFAFLVIKILCDQSILFKLQVTCLYFRPPEGDHPLIVVPTFSSQARQGFQEKPFNVAVAAMVDFGKVEFILATEGTFVKGGPI